MKLSTYSFRSFNSIETDKLENSIIKEHTTIQARAACDLSASRRTALSGTPLQNSLNDIYSLIRFLRLEPFTDRATWTQHIGGLAKSGDALGVSRLQLIMRHLALRRTKDSLDKNGKRILDLPPNNQELISLEFGAAEHAFYSSHHARYKHDFEQLVKADTVMKNYCSILQELLRLRQICVHMALVRDAEDGAAGDLQKSIEENGISKSRAVQLINLMKEAGGVYCSECGTDILPNSSGTVIKEEGSEEEKKPVIKKKKATPKSIPMAEEDSLHSNSSSGTTNPISVITRCQHIFCQACFKAKVCPKWPRGVLAEDRVACSICATDLTPVIDAVELGGEELEKALAEAVEGEIATGKKGKKAPPRVLEHSTKTRLVFSLFSSTETDEKGFNRALIRDLFPFSQANPASANYWGGMDEEKVDEESRTIGFQPVKGVVVKSVVFSQWTKLLDR